MARTHGFFCRTYHKDAARLDYLLRSIDRFAEGFEGITVACPADSHDAIAPVVEKFPFARLVLCNRSDNDFIGQQVTKLTADRYAPYDIISHIDSDCILNKTVSPADLMLNGKPILYMVPYSYFYEHNINMPWQTVTSGFARRQVDYEFMRQFPMSYPRELYADLGSWISSAHGYEIDVLSEHVQGDYFSEFNLLGAFSFYHSSQYHSFVNCLEVAPRSYAEQFCLFSSREDRSIQRDDRERLDQLLGLDNILVPRDRSDAGSSSRLLAGTPLSEMFYSPGSSAYAIVTFGHNGMLANGDDWWAKALFRALDIEGFGIVARRPHWYPASDFESYLEARRVMDASSRKPRIGYGYSMGAYAAVKHAAALGLDTVLAYAPLWSIDPADLQGTPCPWSTDYDAFVNEGMRISSSDIGSARIFLFYDPLERSETFHARKIASLVPAGQVQLIPVHHTGHGVVGTATGLNNFKIVVEAALDGGGEAAWRLTRHARRAKKELVDYLFSLAVALWDRKHYALFAELVEKGLGLHPDHPRMRLLAGRLAALRGDRASLDRFMGGLAHEQPEDSQVHVWWGEAARQLGLREEAIRHFQKAMALNPEATWLQCWIGELASEQAAGNSAVQSPGASRDEALASTA